jgi:hypothetical protein
MIPDIGGIGIFRNGAGTGSALVSGPGLQSQSMDFINHIPAFSLESDGYTVASRSRFTIYRVKDDQGRLVQPPGRGSAWYIDQSFQA